MLRRIVAILENLVYVSMASRTMAMGIVAMMTLTRDFMGNVQVKNILDTATMATARIKYETRVITAAAI